MSTPDYSIKDIEKVVQGIDGVIKKVDITRLTLPGENYISLVFRVDFEVENDGETKTVSTVAKRLPLTKIRMEFNSIGMRNEINWYSVILPQLKEAGKEFGIDTDHFPEYLGGRFSLDPSQTEADNESVLFLKNLNPEGYRNEDRHIGFDLATSKATLRGLAAYHALPLIMKFKKPEQFESIKQLAIYELPMPGPPPDKDAPDKDAPERQGPPAGKLFETMLEIPACRPYSAGIKALQLKSKGGPNWHLTGPEPWNTFAHNDYWVNNILVKHPDGEEPLITMVDFQFFSYASYAKDVVFFLLTSVNIDVIKRHFEELIRYYYDQLTEILEKAHVPELKLSYEDYLEEMKRVALESETGHAIFFSTVIFAEKGAAPDFLTGEGDLFAHIKHINDNISDAQIEKLGTIAELCGSMGWL